MPNPEQLRLPPEEELAEEVLRSASGPGGQNVNKTATAVRLTWNFAESAYLSANAKARLFEHEPSGTVMFLAREYRDLPRNREAARARLSALISAVIRDPKKRRKTKPTRASKQRRLAAKSRRGDVKRSRAKVSPE